MSARARARGQTPGSPRAQGVLRRRATAGAALALALLAGIVTLSEALRHPAPAGEATVAPEGADPRTEVDCPEPADAADEGSVAAPGTPPREASADDLRDCPDAFDRVRVSYEGEVVGAVMRRASGAWLQVNDDVYAGVRGPLPAHRDYWGANAPVGVFVPHDVADAIGSVGGPGRRGDLVSVVGEFQRVDPATREVGVIRATSGEVVRPGGPLEDVRLPRREAAAGLLAALALGLVAGERLHARRWRRG